MSNDTGRQAITIMIVDDELFYHQVLGDILAEEGFTVVATAMDGAEAVAKYRTVRPRLIIMDIFMPEKNGIEATREIMALDPNANVLICSGAGYDDDLEAAMQAGARGVIYKPFVPVEITGTITQVVSGT
jgi:two-component system, chemotaxis family, chemotaxis protein CheY